MRTAALACAVCVAMAAGIASAATGPPGGTVAARVLANPLSVELFVPAGTVKAGTNVRLRAEVSNDGQTTVQNVGVSLAAPQGVVLRDPVTQVVPRIGRGASRRVHWDACSPTADGFVFVVRATTGQFTAVSAGALVQIVPAKRPAC